jgi:drug/metabolite transporter (DMT)-like permease
MHFLGELAALGTAACWSCGTVLFTEAARLIGSFKLNKIRLAMAALLYGAALLVTTGNAYPTEINASQSAWLALSAFMGLVFGDSCGFKAMVILGPRLSSLVFATAPIMTIFIAWIFLGEQLGVYDLLGVAITIAGIGWVISEQRQGPQNHEALALDHPDKGTFAKGVMLALGAAFGQASGLVMTKQAMFNAGGVVRPLDASAVRMVFAAAMIWAISAFGRQIPGTLRELKNRRAMAFSAAGAVMGPFLGIWMLLFAVSKIPAGVAATLSATVPVMVIPIAIIYYKERVSYRAILGAVVTVAGIALIFLHSPWHP